MRSYGYSYKMNAKEYQIQGIHLTIQNKPAFEMVGFKKPANLGDGSIGAFIHQLTESGKIQKLKDTSTVPTQVWVCLSDCQFCGMGCTGYHVCCRVCVEKTERHDFSAFEEQELYAFSLPASEWVLYETHNPDATKTLHQIGIYELIKQVGYQWNETIRLHFDNEHECYDKQNTWIPGKTYHLLLPVTAVK